MNEWMNVNFIWNLQKLVNVMLLGECGCVWGWKLEGGTAWLGGSEWALLGIFTLNRPFKIWTWFIYYYCSIIELDTTIILFIPSFLGKDFLFSITNHGDALPF